MISAHLRSFVNHWRKYISPRFVITFWLLVGLILNVGAQTKKDGNFRFELEERKRPNLESDERNQTNFALKAEYSIEHELSEDITLFGEVETAVETLRRPGRSRESNIVIQRGETWVHWHELPKLDDLGVQLGRIEHADEREWWWDEELDSVGALGDKGNWDYGLFIGKELFSNELDESIDPEDRGIRRIFGNATYTWREKHDIGLYFLDHSDRSSRFAVGDIVSEAVEDEFDADLNWIGFSATGSIDSRSEPRFEYWLDLAYVSGREAIVDFDDFGDDARIVDELDTERVSGSAINLGVTWHPRLRTRPWVSLGFARTSSKSGDLEDDRGFRQTGIHDNEARFGGGVESFAYYGLALDPELSNLQILTLGIGAPLMSDSSIQLLFHDYRQVDRRTFLRDTNLSVDPNGVDRKLGIGADLVLSLEEWDNWEFQLFAGIFRAGDAFGERKGTHSYNIKLELEYKF